MCKDCGCGLADETDQEHERMHALGIAHEHHEHGEGHTHGEHTHDHTHEATRSISLQRRILQENDEIAERNRTWFAERGITAVNLISAPGTGKTFLLERTLERLSGRLPCAVVAGDQKTDNDARRLSGKGAPVIQIETPNSCHLDAKRVEGVLEEVVKEGTRLLFIENVGNLVCPAAYDLGESFKIALMSVTEGEDKPLKYPTLFTQAPVVVLTKTDLIPHLDWDLPTCRENLRRVHPGVFLFELSAKTGDGMDGWIEYLEKLASK